MSKDVSKQINEIEPERWHDVMDKVTSYFDMQKSYTITYEDRNVGVMREAYITVTAPTKEETKELFDYCLEIKNRKKLK